VFAPTWSKEIAMGSLLSLTSVDFEPQCLEENRVVPTFFNQFYKLGVGARQGGLAPHRSGKSSSFHIKRSVSQNGFKILKVGILARIGNLARSLKL